jgi:hypothetical protein
VPNLQVVSSQKTLNTTSNNPAPGSAKMNEAFFPLFLVFGPGLLILLSSVSVIQFTTLFRGAKAFKGFGQAV